MRGVVINQPVRKAFTFYADPQNVEQPYVAIGAEERADRPIYVGMNMGGAVHEILLERADVDAAALKSRWSAVSNLRV
jgi:hypothetical protein